MLFAAFYMHKMIFIYVYTSYNTPIPDCSITVSIRNTQVIKAEAVLASALFFYLMSIFIKIQFSMEGFTWKIIL